MAAPLNLVLLPVGSAGDVHPIVGIGIALKERGHRVTVCTNGYFRDLIERNGLGYEEWGTREQFLAAISDPDVWHPTRAPKKIFATLVTEMLYGGFERLRERMQREEFIMLASPLCMAARLINEKFRVPLITSHLQPLVFRSVYERPGLPMTFPGAPRWWLRFLVWAGDVAIIDPAVCPSLNKLRAEIGLPPVGRVMGEWWHSPDCILGLWPEWYAKPQADWPKNVQLTGFPLYDERTVMSLPPGLADFLAAGPAPIAFTPGSAMRHGREFFEQAALACQKLNRRGLLLTRFKENVPSSLPADVTHVEFAPFSLLLPKCAALVHHGGIGTMAQAFAAGIPQLVMPMAHDQPDNALRIARLGAGTSISRRRFTAANVARKLDALLSDVDVQRRCAEIRAKIAKDRPLEKACEVIERFGAQRSANRPALEVQQC